jgi:2,3-bisphosphoglycerate-dependent phosphoglycerate mutase
MKPWTKLSSHALRHGVSFTRSSQQLESFLGATQSGCNIESHVGPFSFRHLSSNTDPDSPSSSLTSVDSTHLTGLNGFKVEAAKENAQKLKRSGPVLLKNTPRSIASEKQRSVVNRSTSIVQPASSITSTSCVVKNSLLLEEQSHRRSSEADQHHIPLYPVDPLPPQQLNGLNGSHPKLSDMTPSSGSTTDQQGAAVTAPDTNTTTTTTPHHPAHHYLNGGTPCDPAPPPFRLANFGEESLYTLVLLRHGESEWNLQNRYTGWCDVNLTENGRKEARDAGRQLFENGIEIDQAFTSVLKRASFSCNMALNTSRQHWVPITKTWRLNERHYGALQGYNKDSAWRELNLDQELVMQMRRSYDVRPPRMDDHHSYWHGHDRRYRKLSSEQMERSRAESLKDCADRIMPFFNNVVVPSMRAGNRCLIVSHANTIRTLIKNIDGISDEDIKGMTIPTGIPLLYRLDENLQPVDPKLEQEFRYLIEPKG